MLTLYHMPISPNSRRVWVALLEKALPFELVSVSLKDGEQFQPDFLALNPFHHIPVLVDDGFRVVESLAILDYLEARYPTPALLPTDPQRRAIVRMVELLTTNELQPAYRPLLSQLFGLSDGDPAKIAQAQQQVGTVLSFFEQLLGDDRYFGGSDLSLAEIVAGTVIPALPQMGVALESYPKLQAWCDRLQQRDAWQTTQPSARDMAEFRSSLKARLSLP